MKLFRFFLIILLCSFVFLSAKIYQFKAQGGQVKLKDVMLTFDDFILELREDGFFYNVEDNNKDIELGEKKIINYQLEYNGENQNGEVSLGSGIINVDVSSFQAKNKKKDLKELTKTRAKKTKSIPASKFNLSQEEARRIPGAGNDILRTVSALPGVQGTADANGEIYIRGSGKEDIYYSINSIRISNPFHSMGFYSAIPNILINNLNVYLGGFDAKFYNTQGGVIQAVTKKLKDYPARKVSVEAELGVAVASLNLNIPILNNLRLNVGGRRSYYEVWLKILEGIYNSTREDIEKIDTSKVRPYFFDANVFLDWDINKYNQLKFFTIFADDGFLINLGRIPIIRGSFSEDADGEVIESEVTTNFIDLKMDTHEAWNIQGIEYNFDSLSGIKNTLSLYRYSVTNNTSINKRQLSFFTRDQYALKDDFTLSFSKDLFLSLGAFINYEVAKISVFEHPEGKVQPRKENYGLGHDADLDLIYQNPILYTIFSLSRDSSDDFDPSNIKKFQDDSEEYNTNLVEKKLSPKRLQTSGYASLNFSLIEDLLIHTGVNSTYNDYSKKINIDPRVNISYFLLKQFTLSLKGGIYSQLPDLYIKELYTVNPEDGLAIIQRLKLKQDDSKTPYSYHINLGFNTTLFNVLQLNIEGYYRHMEDQTIANPTYDSKYDASSSNNPRTLNSGKGLAYGADIFLKQRILNNTFGWVSYSWSRSLRYQFTDLDFAFVGNDSGNNGNDYKTNKMGWIPFARNIEHTFRIVYSLGFSKDDIIGIRAELTSGLPYTPNVIDTRYTNEDGTAVWSVREGELYSRNYPLRWKLDMRYDKTVLRFGGAKLSLFIDVADLQKLIFKPITKYVFPTKFANQYLLEGARGEGPLKDLKDGDPVPEEYYITEAEKNKQDGTTSGGPGDLPLITLGVLFKY